MTATIESTNQFELYSLLDNFRTRHTWVSVIGYYQRDNMYYIDVKFRD